MNIHELERSINAACDAFTSALMTATETMLMECARLQKEAEGLPPAAVQGIVAAAMKRVDAATKGLDA